MELITQQQIGSKIYAIRDVQIMLDNDLVQMNPVETRALNQAVKRNSDRFPDDFIFQLTAAEWQNLKSQKVTLSFHGGFGKLQEQERNGMAFYRMFTKERLYKVLINPGRKITFSISALPNGECYDSGRKESSWQTFNCLVQASQIQLQ